MSINSTWLHYPSGCAEPDEDYDDRLPQAPTPTRTRLHRRGIHFWLSKQAQFSVLCLVTEPDQYVPVQGVPKSEIDVESVDVENPIVRHQLWAFRELFSR